MSRFTIYSGHRECGWRVRRHKKTRLGMRVCALQMGPGAEVMDWERGVYHGACGQKTRLMPAAQSEVVSRDQYWPVVVALGRLVGTLVALYVVMDLLLFVGLF